MDLQEADGLLTNTTLSGDAFPGTAKVTAFAGFKTWGGASLSPSLYGIVETDGTICFSTDSAHKTIRCADTLPLPTSLARIGKLAPQLTLGYGTLGIANPQHRALQVQAFTLGGRELGSVDMNTDIASIPLSRLVPHGIFLVRLIEQGALLEQRTITSP